MCSNINQGSTEVTKIVFSKELKKKIDFELTKYPEDRKKSAVMASLTHAQDEYNGYLTNEIIKAVADYLQIPRIFAEEAATFYSMYEHKPMGLYKICVCITLSCKMRGSKEIVSHLKKKLGINFGEVTPDGVFSLKHVACLGACRNAPVIQIGKVYYEDLTIEKIDKVLDELKKKAVSKKGISNEN